MMWRMVYHFPHHFDRRRSSKGKQEKLFVFQLIGACPIAKGSSASWGSILPSNFFRSHREQDDVGTKMMYHPTVDGLRKDANEVLGAVWIVDWKGW